MPSALTALPTITSTALGSNTALVGGAGKSPTVVNGFAVAMDSLNFYVQTQDSNLFNISATATSTQTTGDQTNTYHKGAVWYFTYTANATCTVKFGVQIKEPITSTYITAFNSSLDGLSGTQVGFFFTYPSGGNSNGNVLSAFDIPLPLTFRVQASITATASGGGFSLTNFVMGQSKVL